jgi:hypothetical protein
VDELGDDQVGDLLLDLAAQEDDAVIEETGVDVKRARSPRAVCSTTMGMRGMRISFCFALLMCNRSLAATRNLSVAHRWRLPG